jgi:hypothetical protein
LNGHVEASDGVTRMTRRERDQATRGKNNGFIPLPPSSALGVRFFCFPISLSILVRLS